jgi:hypothetical protein
MSRYLQDIGFSTLFAVALVITWFGCASPRTLKEPVSEGDLVDSGFADADTTEDTFSGIEGTGGVTKKTSTKGAAGSTRTVGTGGKGGSPQSASTGGNTDSAQTGSTGGSVDSTQNANTGGKGDSTTQTPGSGGNTGSVRPPGAGGRGASTQTGGSGGRNGSRLPIGIAGRISEILTEITAGRFDLGDLTCDPKDANTLSNCVLDNACCTDDGRCGVSVGSSCRSFIQSDGGFSMPIDAGFYFDRDAGIWRRNDN